MASLPPIFATPGSKLDKSIDGGVHHGMLALLQAALSAAGECAPRRGSRREVLLHWVDGSASPVYSGHFVRTDSLLPAIEVLLPQSVLPG